MTKESKLECLVRYLTRCGMTKEKALEKAQPIIDKGDCCTLFGRKFNKETLEWEEFFVENFTCLMEYLEWKDIDNLKAMGVEETLFLDAKDPFYSSAWGHLPKHCIHQCCLPVQKRAEQGL